MLSNTVDIHKARRDNAASAGDGVRSAVLKAVECLPPLASVALAAAAEYLRSLSSEGVLRQCVGFRPFQDAASMVLSPNALRQLEARTLPSGTLCSPLRCTVQALQFLPVPAVIGLRKSAPATRGMLNTQC